MNRMWMILPLGICLWGCAPEETLETVEDEWLQPVMAVPGSLSLQLPETAEPVLETDTEQMYLQEDSEILVQTLSSGDLGKTISTICGYDRENLTILNTFTDGVERYEFVWASAGEQGERLGRAVILDDGNYHYCLSVVRDAQSDGDAWQDLFRSFSLV